MPGPFAIWTVSQVGSIVIRSSGTQPAFTAGLGSISGLMISVKAGEKGLGGGGGGVCQFPPPQQSAVLGPPWEGRVCSVTGDSEILQFRLLSRRTVTQERRGLPRGREPTSPHLNNCFPSQVHIDRSTQPTCLLIPENVRSER